MRKLFAAVAVLAVGTWLLTAAETTLLDAASSGDHDAAMQLVKSGNIDVNATLADGTTALMYAAANDDLDLVKALIAAGADVKLANKFGTSAITEASIIGSAPIVKALLAAGADPNFRTTDGETPLMEAARSGHVQAARELLDAGADINAKEGWGEQNALMWAAAQSQADMVEFLAGRGADLNEHGKVNQWERKTIQEPRPKDLNKGGFTALHYAAREGCVRCVKDLLAAGADPDVEDPDRVTPLILSLINLHFDTAAALIEGGADLNKWDLYGRSPIYMAADVNTLPVKGNGARAVIPSEDELTAMDIGRMLLERGANPNLQLKRRPPYRDVPQDRGGDNMLSQGATPLLRAARAGDAEFVQLLLDHGALVDLGNKNHITPLMAAAGVDFGARVTRGRNRTDEGVLKTMALLIDAGADVNAQTLSDPFSGFGRRGRGGGGRGGGGRGGGAGRGGAGRGGGAAGGGRPATFSAGDSASARIAQSFRRGSQMPSANALPDETPLHGAAARGYNAFIEFLVENGADLTAKNSRGQTPLEVARGASGNRGGADAFPETVALLEKLMKEQGLPIPPPPPAQSGE